MQQPHLYLTHNFVVTGTPIPKDDFMTETGAKLSSGEHDEVFLKDVTIVGSCGALAEVGYLILRSAATAGVGRKDLRLLSGPPTPEMPEPRRSEREEHAS